MKFYNLLKIATQFSSLASSQSSKNLSTILKNIESLHTYKDKIDCAEHNLKHLSSGSSRIIYLSPNESVIKLAKNDRGLAQNKVEANIKSNSKFVNKPKKFAKNYSWLEVDFLDDLSEKEFEEFTNFSFKNFGSTIKSTLKSHHTSDISPSSSPSSSSSKSINKIKSSPLFKDICELIKSNDLIVGDVIRISSWRTNGEYPILADTGLNRNVFNKYYASSSSSSSS